MKKPSIVIWDWNGTIFDDLQISLDAVNYILENRALPPIGREEYYEYLDTPIIKFYQRALGREDVPFEDISREFNVFYRENIHRAGLTAGVLPIIKELHEMKVPQVIISASHISYIEEKLRELSMEMYFDKIIAAEDYAAGSKLERAEKYMESSGIPRQGRVVIGDTCHDFLMAKTVGGECILLTGGHEGEKKISTTGAKIVDKLKLSHILSLVR